MTNYIPPTPSQVADRIDGFKVKWCDRHFRTEFFYLDSLIGSASGELPNEEVHNVSNHVLSRLIEMDMRAEFAGTEHPC